MASESDASKDVHPPLAHEEWLVPIGVAEFTPEYAEETACWRPPAVTI